MAKVEDGTWNHASPKNVSLGKAFDDYRAYSKIHHRSHATYVEPALKFWERELGRDTPLAKISTTRLEQVKMKRFHEVAPATVDKSLGVLKAFFSWCEAQGTFNINPVRKIKFFNPNNELVRYLTKEQYERLLEGAQKIRWYLRPLIILAVHTGLRRANLLGLRWDHIDFMACVIRITDSTKNRRTLAVPLNDTALETLNLVKEKTGDGEYVFPHFEGEFAGEAIRDIKNSFKTALRRAGITDFRWHDLRHCFASWLVMSGIDLAAVQKLLGHRSTRMTLRYAHLSPRYLADQVKALDKVFPVNFPGGAAKSGKEPQTGATERPQTDGANS
jgi:integrase